MRVGRRARYCLAGVLLFAPACKSTEPLETELRTREVQHEQLVNELNRIRHENCAMQQELLALRQLQAPPPEIAGPSCGLRRVTIGRLSGGRDLDQVAGDDALYLTVEPRDGMDHIVKVPGSLHVTALEVNCQGIKTPLCTWNFPPDKLASCWQQTIFTTGYTLTLPWLNCPANEDVRIVARFVVTDGRVFEADKDIRVQLSPLANQLPRPLPGVMPPPGPLDEGLPTPQPLPVQPARSVSIRQPVPLQNQ